MGEYKEVYRHEGKEWLAVDYVKSEGDNLPEFYSEPASYKITLRGHEVHENEEGKLEEGNEQYISTNIFDTLDEAEGNAEFLRRSYKGKWEQDDVIIRVYFPVN